MKYLLLTNIYTNTNIYSCTFMQKNVPLVALCLMTVLANIHSLKTPLYAISRLYHNLVFSDYL